MIPKSQLPNLLTYLRIAIVPAIVFAFYIPGETGMIGATVLFMLAGVTDWLDGFLARKWSVQSDIGRFLDPIADKLLVATCLLLLVGEGRAAIIPAIAITCREILVSGLREFLAEIQVTVHVTKLAKYKTASQMLAVFLLLWNTASPEWLAADFFGNILLWFSAALTLITGYEYIRAGWRHMEPPQTSPESTIPE